MRSHTSNWAGYFARTGWPVSRSRRDGLFLVHGARPMLVAVTAGLTETALAAAIPDLELAAHLRDWDADLMVVGAHPFPAVRTYLASDPPAGLLGQRVRAGWQEPPLARDGDRPMPVWRRAGWDWSAGLWIRCDQCGRLAVYHETRDWDARPCGHSGERFMDAQSVPSIGRRWAAACYTRQPKGAQCSPRMT